MSNIYNILCELDSNPSRIAKEEILNREINNSILKLVIESALNPKTNYFIKQIPPYTQSSERIDIQSAFMGLNKICDREVTGNAARNLLADILGSLSQEDAEVIKRVVLKDLRCGVNTATVNKIWKKLIPEFTYMRCSLSKSVNLSEWDWVSGIYSQEKADAMFANMDVYDDEIVLTSRSGTVIPTDKFSYVTDYALQQSIKNMRIHGELIVFENGDPLPRETSNGIMNSIAKGGDFDNANQTVKFMVWDQIPIVNANSGETYNVQYCNRFARLKGQFTDDGCISIIPTKIVHSYEAAVDHYMEMIQQHKEGTVIKTQTGVWKDTTSKEQVKMKMEVTVDLRIVKFNEGNGKNAKTFGSIMCETSEGLLKVNVSGFTDKQREEINRKQEDYLGKIMSVTSNKLLFPSSSSKFYSLFLPRMSEIREDKFDPDSLSRVKEEFESVIGISMDEERNVVE